MTRWIRTALLTLAIVGMAVVTNAQTFDLATDWSDVNNPNGVWRLYKAPGRLFTINQSDWYSNGQGQHAWADQPYQQTAHVPVWMKFALPISNPFVVPGTVIMHGAESSRTGTEFSSVTWTSPLAGMVTIFGNAWVEKSANRPMIWELRKNGVSLTQGLLTQSDPYTRNNPFDFANGSGGASVLNFNVIPNDVVELLIYRRSSATPSTFVATNLQIIAGPTAVVSGRVTLQGAINQAQPVIFEFRPTDGTASFRRVITLNANRTYSLPDIPRKAYTLWVKGERWLAQTRTVDAATGNVSNINFTLPAGDANNDNSVDALDLAELITAFNSEIGDGLYNPIADFNTDDSCDALDLALLIENFNTEGAP